ncbi:hypothetical protein KKG52_02080 [Patescibacteria group bacterium]|nr:hypothetical protein [Patescibacteria group bacterium]
MIYASPVDRKTGIIGDFEMTLYFGKNPQIAGLLKTNLEIIKELFVFAKIGMSLSEITKKGLLIIKEKGLSNNVLSINDPTSTNIGHTIPFSYEKLSKSEKNIIKAV